jgi:hypothetical protein
MGLFIPFNSVDVDVDVDVDFDLVVVVDVLELVLDDSSKKELCMFGCC